jgi:hypothetical protein
MQQQQLLQAAQLIGAREISPRMFHFFQPLFWFIKFVSLLDSSFELSIYTSG